MSEAFTPLSAPEAVAAAHRIYARVDAALSIRRGLTGVQDREIVSVVILARQLDAMAQLAAHLLTHGVVASLPDGTVPWRALREGLTAAGYLPLPETPAHQEPAHGKD